MTFHLVNYSAGVGGSNSNFWRGYRFRVAYPIVITRLFGGATATGFNIGLYEANGDRRHTLLGSAPLPAARRSEVSIDPVLLMPGVDYVIAQGRSTGSGSHYVIDTISPDINDDPVIESWNPTNVSGALNWDNSGSVNYILYSTPGTTLIRPDIGFEYE